MPTEFIITNHSETTCTVSLNLPGCFSVHFGTQHLDTVRSLLSALEELKALEVRAWAALEQEIEEEALYHHLTASAF